MMRERVTASPQAEAMSGNPAGCSVNDLFYNRVSHLSLSMGKVGARYRDVKVVVVVLEPKLDWHLPWPADKHAMYDEND